MHNRLHRRSTSSTLWTEELWRGDTKPQQTSNSCQEAKPPAQVSWSSCTAPQCSRRPRLLLTESLPPQYTAPPPVIVNSSSSSSSSSSCHAPSPAVTSTASNKHGKEPERRHSCYDSRSAGRYRPGAHNATPTSAAAAAAAVVSTTSAACRVGVGGEPRLSAMNINGLPDPFHQHGQQNNRSGAFNQVNFSSGTWPSGRVQSIVVSTIRTWVPQVDAMNCVHERVQGCGNTLSCTPAGNVKQLLSIPD